MTSSDRGRDSDYTLFAYYHCPHGHTECFRYNENLGYSCEHAQADSHREYEAEVAAAYARKAAKNQLPSGPSGARAYVPRPRKPITRPLRQDVIDSRAAAQAANGPPKRQIRGGPFAAYANMRAYNKQ